MSSTGYYEDRKSRTDVACTDDACTVYVGPHSLLVFHQQLTGLSERINVLREVYTNSLLSAQIDLWRTELLNDPKLKALASTTTAHAPKHRLSRSRSFIVADTEASSALISQSGRVNPEHGQPLPSHQGAENVQDGLPALLSESTQQTESQSQFTACDLAIRSDSNTVWAAGDLPASEAPVGSVVGSVTETAGLCTQPASWSGVVRPAQPACSLSPSHTEQCAKRPASVEGPQIACTGNGIGGTVRQAICEGARQAGLHQSTEHCGQHPRLRRWSHGPAPVLPALQEAYGHCRTAEQLGKEANAGTKPTASAANMPMPILTGVTAEIVHLITSRLTDVMTATHHKIPSALIRDVLECVSIAATLAAHTAFSATGAGANLHAHPNGSARARPPPSWLSVCKQNVSQQGVCHPAITSKAHKVEPRVQNEPQDLYSPSHHTSTLEAVSVVALGEDTAKHPPSPCSMHPDPCLAPELPPAPGGKTGKSMDEVMREVAEKSRVEDLAAAAAACDRARLARVLAQMEQQEEAAAATHDECPVMGHRRGRSGLESSDEPTISQMLGEHGHLVRPAVAPHRMHARNPSAAGVHGGGMFVASNGNILSQPHSVSSTCPGTFAQPLNLQALPMNSHLGARDTNMLCVELGLIHLDAASEIGSDHGSLPPDYHAPAPHISGPHSALRGHHHTPWSSHTSLTHPRNLASLQFAQLQAAYGTNYSTASTSGGMRRQGSHLSMSSMASWVSNTHHTPHNLLSRAQRRMGGSVYDAQLSYAVYNKLGGWDALSAAVQGMYARLCADERTRGFFEHADDGKLVRHMTTFIGCAVTGRFMYSARQLRTMHGHHMERGMGPGHVDIMTDFLRATLSEEVGASQEVIDTCTRVLQHYRNVFARGASYDPARMPKAHPDYDAEELEEWQDECEEEKDENAEDMRLAN